MNYLELFKSLKSKVNYIDDHISFGEIDIYNYTFNSNSFTALPGNSGHYCSLHNISFPEEDSHKIDVDTIEGLKIIDTGVESNKSFRYHIFKPKSVSKAKDIILLFHGFNEKNWDKYLPWAYKIANDTKKLIVLFPIAFHMNRAPMEWSDKRKMYSLSEERRKRFPDIVNSALANVAISVRLHSMPQRFIWSGLQTYYDVIQFVEDCKIGNHILIEKDCSIDFFCYSIGCFLAEIIKMSDYKGYFTNSKVCMFCGGPVFNRLSPVSKFILDSEANIALYAFLVENISSHLKRDKRLKHYLSEAHPEGLNFYSMLNYKLMTEYREELFKNMCDDIYAIVLKKDLVIPPYEVINTLRGSSRDINIPIDVLDLPYDYIHEDPFPAKESIIKEVNENFIKIFDKFCKFLLKNKVE